LLTQSSCTGRILTSNKLQYNYCWATQSTAT
jgi:tRNA(Phe) wybutosine-synthesizing methylase Tyw3